MSKKNIYLEVGAYSLRWTLNFLKHHLDKDWVIYLFEPSPVFEKKIKDQIKTYNLKNIYFYPIAVFNKNDIKEFYMGYKKQQSSTLFKEKKRFIKYDKFVKVICIDFDQWIKDNLNIDDYIYMNMDIEGAEYYVLPHLIKNKTINYFNELKIEFHAHKFIGENRKKFDKIHKELKKYFIDNKFDLSKFQHFK